MEDNIISRTIKLMLTVENAVDTSRHNLYMHTDTWAALRAACTDYGNHLFTRDREEGDAELTFRGKEVFLRNDIPVNQIIYSAKVPPVARPKDQVR